MTNMGFSNRIRWKVMHGRGLVSRIYRYFWRKRMIRRINKVSEEISRRSQYEKPCIHHTQYTPYDLSHTTPMAGIGTYGTGAQCGVPVIDPKQSHVVIVPVMEPEVPENTTTYSGEEY